MEIMVIGLAGCCCLLVLAVAVYLYMKSSGCDEGKVFSFTRFDCEDDASGNDPTDNGGTTGTADPLDDILKNLDVNSGTSGGGTSGGGTSGGGTSGGGTSNGGSGGGAQTLHSKIEDYSQADIDEMQELYDNEGKFTFCGYKSDSHVGEYKLLTIDADNANNQPLPNLIKDRLSEEGMKSMFYSKDVGAVCPIILESEVIKSNDYITITRAEGGKYLRIRGDNAVEFVTAPDQQCELEVAYTSAGTAVNLSATQANAVYSINNVKYTQQSDGSYTLDGVSHSENTAGVTTFVITKIAQNTFSSADKTHPRCLYQNVDHTGPYKWVSAGPTTAADLSAGYQYSDPPDQGGSVSACRYIVAAGTYLSYAKDYFIAVSTGGSPSDTLLKKDTDGTLATAGASQVLETDPGIRFRVEILPDSIKIKRGTSYLIRRADTQSVMTTASASASDVTLQKTSDIGVFDIPPMRIGGTAYNKMKFIDASNHSLQFKEQPPPPPPPPILQQCSSYTTKAACPTPRCRWQNVGRYVPNAERRGRCR